MISSISNTGNFTGGFFIRNEPLNADLLLDPSDFLLTYKSEKGILRAINKLISEASKNIKICSFIIDNKQVFDLLMACLKEKRVAIFILTAVNEKDIRTDLLNEEEADQVMQNRHFEFIGELVKNGAHVRASGNAHAKFVIRDNEEAIIMTANLTEPSLNNNHGGKEPNPESGLRFIHPDEIRSLDKLFDAIFLYGTEYRKFITLDNGNQLIDKKEVSISVKDLETPTNSVVWTYEKIGNHLYHQIINAINKADKTIKISTYSIVGLHHLNELTSALQEFISVRKGSVHIFCRAMNHRPDHLLACDSLSKMGCKIYGDMFNHSKGILVDDEIGILFTANIDGNHGLINGFEVGSIIKKDSANFASFKNFLTHQIDTAPFIYQQEPLKEQLFEFYSYWYRDRGQKPSSMPGNFDLVIRSNAQYANELLQDIAKHPVFYSIYNGHDQNQRIQFEINGKYYDIKNINSSTLQVGGVINRTDSYKGEKYLLFYNNINLQRYES